MYTQEGLNWCWPALPSITETHVCHNPLGFHINVDNIRTCNADLDGEMENLCPYRILDYSIQYISF